MADRLVPRPRDFRRGVYKIRRTMQGELPIEDDLFQIIRNGMPGTSMPAWQAKRARIPSNSRSMAAGESIEGVPPPM